MKRSETIVAAVLICVVIGVSGFLLGQHSGDSWLGNTTETGRYDLHIFLNKPFICATQTGTLFQYNEAYRKPSGFVESRVTKMCELPE